MRCFLWPGFVVVLLGVGGGAMAAPAVPAFHVGMAQRTFVPAGPYNWRSDPKYALSTLIWYPAASTVVEQPLLLGPPGQPLFEGGRAAVGAAVALAPAQFPLIVLSHGTGGTAEGLAWLGTALAASGYVVAAVEHPGNNGIDGYTVAGFALWWLRSRDLSAVIDGMLADPIFGPRLDPARIGAAGHSLGGYTVIAIAGGITSLAHLRAVCASPAAYRRCASPPEFPDLRAKIEALAKSDPAFRAAWAEDGRSYRDARVRAVFAMAPALGQAFLPASLAKIDIPVAIIAGAADEIMPVRNNARFLAARIPHASLTILPGSVGHYVFTDECTAAWRAALPPRLCTDAPGVDRGATHRETAQFAAAFFAGSLH